MKEPKFIALTSLKELQKTWCEPGPWIPQHYDLIPVDQIGYSPGFLTVTGSGCITHAFSSMATTSIYGHIYPVAFDVFRNDWENGRQVIDVDHFVGVPFNSGSLAIWHYPPTPYHHLKSTDSVIQYLPKPWQFTIKQILSDLNEINDDTLTHPH